MKTPDKSEVLQNCKITDYLGIPLGKKILSPFRVERTPSFHVFNGRNGNEMFVDHGAATGDPARSGDVIKLHMLLRGVGFNEACCDLMGLDYSVPAYVPATGTASGYSKPKMSEAEIAAKYGIRSDRHPRQSRYVQYTGLPVPEWIIKAFGLYTDTQSNLCIPTSGGIHCKGGKLRDKEKTFALNVGAAGISVSGNLTATEWYVVEGIGDLLALIDGAVGSKHVSEQKYGYICTNSTSNVAAVIDYLLSVPQLDVVHLYLDKQTGKDNAADRDTASILAAIPVAVDCRGDIVTGKDLRDVWDAKHR